MEEYLAIINDLIHQIHLNYNRIKGKADSLKDFNIWVRKAQSKGMYRVDNIKPLGMSRSSVYSWNNRLKSLKNKIKSRDIQENEIEEKLGELKNIVLIFSKAVDDYYIQYSENVDPFEGRKWYVYFFLIDEESGREPTLGRVVLNTVSKDHVELKNLGRGVHLDYEKGQYSLIYNYACFLELETKYGDRKLHIKVRYMSSGFEIFIGSYITYENDHVVRGTIVMEPAKGEDIKPAVLSSFKNKELFNSLDPAILSFLSLRRYNYQIISNRIFSLDGLRDFMHEKRGEDWATRFIEEKEPTLFIAYPGLSLEDAGYEKNTLAVENIAQKLNQRFGSKISIYSDNERAPSALIAFSDEIERLKRTRIFVLIYTKTNNLGSYSLVQLGLAMAYCKVVMMFYELGSVSSHLEILHKKVQKIPLPSGLENESTCQIIYKTIEAKVEESCEKWL